MSRNATIELMKRHMDELAYSSVQIEGIASTFAQTGEVMERGAAEGLDERSLVKLLGIKHALEFLFDNFDDEISWGLYSTYNRLVGAGNVPKAGEMRGPGEVSVGDFIPGDVSEGAFRDILDTAVETGATPSERATTLFLLLCRAQFFHDGNKRSAQMLANHYLAKEDARRLLVVPENGRGRVLDLLVDFYHGATSLQDAEWDMEEMVIKTFDNEVLHDRGGDGLEMGGASEMPSAVDVLRGAGAIELPAKSKVGPTSTIGHGMT